MIVDLFCDVVGGEGGSTFKESNYEAIKKCFPLVQKAENMVMCMYALKPTYGIW